MYFYFYDSFLNDKKYENLLTEIEGRLLDLGISGKVGKLSVLKNARELIEDGIKMGCKTVVAIGDDQTISKVISIIANYEVILGFIPVGASSKIAESLGIPQGAKACDVLSARIMEKIDLGKANDHYFFSAVETPPSQVTLECDGKYQVELQESKSVCISNLGNFFSRATKDIVSNPKDGILEVIIYPSRKTGSLNAIFKKEQGPDSFFPIKKVKIVSEKGEVPVVADGQETLKTPVMIEVAPKKLQVVVGKRRIF